MFIYIVHVIVRVLLPLLIGGMIYLCLGNHGIRLVKWSMNIGFLEIIRNNFSEIVMPDWLIFNLTDGLWLFALLQLMDMIWAEKDARHIWMVLSVLLALGHELGQLAGIFSGTFDVQDMLAYGIATICSVFVNRLLLQ